MSQGTPRNTGNDHKINLVQKQVNDVTQVMKQNVAKVLEREKNLTQALDQSEALLTTAQQFHQKARRVKWQQVKQRALCVFLVLVVIAVVLVLFLVAMGVIH